MGQLVDRAPVAGRGMGLQARCHVRQSGPQLRQEIPGDGGSAADRLDSGGLVPGR
jgi:hypothetical protein